MNGIGVGSSNRRTGAKTEFTCSALGTSIQHPCVLQVIPYVFRKKILANQQHQRVVLESVNPESLFVFG